MILFKSVVYLIQCKQTEIGPNPDIWKNKLKMGEMLDAMFWLL